MISKKKLTALAVASLFVTPVMAGTSNNVWKNEISNQGLMWSPILGQIIGDHLYGTKMEGYGRS